MLGTWINTQGSKANIFSVTGIQRKEHTCHHTNLFAATDLPNLSLLETCNNVMQPFNQQILMATPGASNAGLPIPDVYGAECAKFPPTLVDVLQEKKHAGRCPTASPTTDWYLACLSLETYANLLRHVADPSTIKTMLATKAF
jgi:hypothetical protein